MTATDMGQPSPPVPELIPDIYPVAPRGCGPSSILSVREDLPPRPFSTPPRINSRGGIATPNKTCVALSKPGQTVAVLTLCFISFLQAPPVKKKVHSDIALWYSPLRLVIAFVFVFVFVRKFPLRSLGYNTPKVFETVFAFFDRFVKFLPMIICSTFRLALSIRGSFGYQRRTNEEALAMP